jgi:linoleoyl-CoA desaturase
LKDRHIQVESDQQLLKLILRRVNERLVIDKASTRTLIWVKFILYASFAVGGYASLYLVKIPALFLCLFVFYGFAILFLAFNFAHDFSHGTVFRHSVLDNMGFTGIYMLNGAHASAWKKRHVESHHFAPNVEHFDSDLEISNVIRVVPGSPRMWFHRFQHLYAPMAYTTYSLFWVFVKDFVIFCNKRSKTTGFWMSFLFEKTFYVAYVLVLPLLFSQQAWWIVLTGFLLMHLSQSLFLLFTFFMTHHVEGLEYPAVDDNGVIGTSWLMNQVKSSNDIYPFSRAANFVFGGFNNHVAHHLFPNIHHVHYPQLSRIIYETLEQHGTYPSQTTYWGGVISHLRLLRKMGR